MPYIRLPKSPSQIANKEAKELLEIKRKLWYDVYVAFVASSNSVTDEKAPEWADRAVERFDKRFGKGVES